MNFVRISEIYTKYLPLMKNIDYIPRSRIVTGCLDTISKSYSKDDINNPSLSYLHECNTLVIGFRGIRFNNISDWMECVAYFNDKPLEPGMERGVREIIDKHNNYKNICLTGHSLGGYKATLLAHKLKDDYPQLRTIVFNPASICDSGYESRFEKVTNLVTYHIVGDILSSLSGLENPSGIHRITYPHATRQHTITTFKYPSGIPRS